MSTTRVFVGGLPISNTLGKEELMGVVSRFTSNVEIIKDNEGYCKGFAYIQVPSDKAEYCIEKLNGSDFMRGKLRVERAKEPYMDRLKREWKQNAAELPKDFNFDYNAKAGSTPNGTPKANGTTPHKTTVAPANGTTPNKKTTFDEAPEGKEEKKEQSNTEKKKSKYMQQKEEKKAARKAAFLAKQGEGAESSPSASSPSTPASPPAPETAPETTTPKGKKDNKRKGAEKTGETPAAKKQKTEESLFLGDDTPAAMETEPTTETKAAEPTEPAESEAKTPAKKEKTPKKAAAKKASAKKAAAKKEEEDTKPEETKVEETKPEPPKAEEGKPEPPKPETPKKGAAKKAAAKKAAAKKETPATPSTPAPSTPAPSTPAPSTPVTPSTPSSSSGPSAEWDADQVKSWASKNFGSELADKLKSKGVRGRKLYNWKESSNGDAAGLRKQIVDFLQLPESLESDADDLAFAVLKLA